MDAQAQTRPTVTAYYAGDAAQVDSFAAEQLTHIIYSFCHLKGARLHVDNAKDTATIQSLVRMKRRNPDLKVLLSLGGWGGCETCSDVFSSKKNRKIFARSVKELNAFFGTDGIDLDWEYPAIEGYPGHAFKKEDRENFTALIGALRKKLGKEKEISFAAGGFKKFIDEAIEWNKVMPLVDRVNLMTYDLVSGFSAVTGHHTPLYSSPGQPESADNAIRQLTALGIPMEKLVIGAAFYGRVWQDVPDTSNGLYQRGKFRTSIAIRDFPVQFPQNRGFVYHWDDQVQAPYIYNATEKIFVTYDDQRSLELRTKYMLDKGLNGIMFWQLTHDPYRGGLLEAIFNTVQAYWK